MKKFTKFLFIVILSCYAGKMMAQVRYLDEVFTQAQVANDVIYGANISVLTGAPALDTLRCDVYTPVGDTLTDRPVVVYFHTGTFLPTPLNGYPTGDKSDSCVVEICKRLARRGFVAVAANYRLGWNPISTIQEVRTSTIINAVYRGVQDGHTCVRFLNYTNQNGNPFGIDPAKIILFGQGSGGFISLQMAVLDREGEFNIPKFIDPNTLIPYVDTSLSGDIKGLNARPLNIANHVGYSSDFHFSINASGALGDSTWLEGGEVPMVSFHCPNDPLTPFKTGPVLAIGQFVVEVSGSQVAQKMANNFANNACMKDPGHPFHSDGFSTRANAINGGLEGLFPFVTANLENAPWEWWDPNHPNHSNGALTNPNMSKTKAMAYIDTMLGYAIPRVVYCLNMVTGHEMIESIKDHVQIAPNPANEFLRISIDFPEMISKIELFDLTGKLVFASPEIHEKVYYLNRQSLPDGMYFVRMKIGDILLTKKVVFN